MSDSSLPRSSIPPPLSAASRRSATSTSSVGSAMTAPSFNLASTHIVKETWNKTLAWKDAFVEAWLLRALVLSPSLLELLGPGRYMFSHHLFAMTDFAVRQLDPKTEVHGRESWRGVHESSPQPFSTMKGYARHFAELGVNDEHWEALRDAFMFALQTHVPYLEEPDQTDLSKGSSSVMYRFFVAHIYQPCHEGIKNFRHFLTSDAVREAGEHMNQLLGSDAALFGETFYRTLMERYPETMDFFHSSDMDHLAIHFTQLLSILAHSLSSFDTLRPALLKLGELHKRALIPTYSYPLVGEHLLRSLNCPNESIERAWARMYAVVAQLQAQPMALEEALVSAAESWLNVMAAELNWSSAVFHSRFLQIKVEIAKTGSYTHLPAELEYSARLAWRNSAKCIGRINWNSLMVRDRRHVTDPDEMFKECLEHLRIATGGETFQSVMTVFRPRKPHELWGPRFWSTQFVSFAGYKQPDGSVLGDPARAELTEAIIELGWTPPEPRTEWDTLPLVFELPNDKPRQFVIPPENLYIVMIQHPTNTRFNELGLRWYAVPTVSTFNMQIGGIDYVCSPFNGWYADIEIARDLWERYDKGRVIAAAFDLDTSSEQTMWRHQAYVELLKAINFSFKRNRSTLVDQYTVSTQFMTHCTRERDQGREVPGQWSWLGGLVGPVCRQVWGHETREFVMEPQYHYQSEIYLVNKKPEREEGSHGQYSVLSRSSTDSQLSVSSGSTPSSRVLILFGSETGTAERFAARAARRLHKLRPVVAMLNAYADAQRPMLQSFTHVLVIASTFGDGGPPFNGSQFLDEPLPRMVLSTGKPIEFAVLALGSSVYHQFCAFGKKVDAELSKAGALRMIEVMTADEMQNQSDTFDSWLQLVANELQADTAHGDDDSGASDVPPTIEVEFLDNKGDDDSLETSASVSSRSGIVPSRGMNTKWGSVLRKLSASLAFLPAVSNERATRATEQRRQESFRLTKLLKQEDEDDPQPDDAARDAASDPPAPSALAEHVRAFKATPAPKDSQGSSSRLAEIVFKNLRAKNLAASVQALPAAQATATARDTPAAPVSSVIPELAALSLGATGVASAGPRIGDVELARVIRNEELLQEPGPDRSTRRIELDVSGTKFAYETGDHISILPANRPEDVAKLCASLGLSPSVSFRAHTVDGPLRYPAVLPFPMPAKLSDVFQYYLDISLQPTMLSDLLSLLLTRASETSLEDSLHGQLLKSWVETLDAGASARQAASITVSTGTAEDLNEWIDKADALQKEILDQYIKVSDLLDFFSEFKLELGEILQILPRQRPRFYSISSSNKVTPTVVALTVGVLRLPTSSKALRYGVCSNFLADLRPGQSIWVAHRKSNFRLPADASAPVIMVGPGTGIAPLVAFLHERQHLQDNEGAKLGEAPLFFGCRTSSEVLYDTELRNWQQGGSVLTHLGLALSREDPKRKVYVQTLIESSGELIWRLMSDPRCQYFVCGDGSMASSANEALVKVARSVGGLSRVRAVQLIDQMRMEHRYHQDVWGAVLHAGRSIEDIKLRQRQAAAIWMTKFAEGSNRDLIDMVQKLSRTSTANSLTSAFSMSSV
eukprot:TRINITY_DN6686_c0_g1_i3.p1 TRINITY_DN6686_c0_g1~~TRINITY_DN6686_c0_g1_i3.p1  ORF type:complete len:1576 (-),score=643.68 TRINITY_DN6686_c0_g1_i3:181-4908(-)